LQVENKTTNLYMTNKERYRILCEEKPIPLFMQAWWLDAVCVEGKTWDVLLYEENGKILAVMPYHLLKKWGFKIILNPQFTQYNGVWIDYPADCKLHKRYSFEKKIMDNLIDQLEALKPSFYSQWFHYSVTNWQPFYWKKFSQTTRYTYQIKDLSNIEKIYQSFNYAKQKHIKKDNNLQVDFCTSADDFFNFHKECLKWKKAEIAYSRNLFLSIYNESINRKQGVIISLKDIHQNLHSALFVIWDRNNAYSIISAINPQFKSNGTSTKIVWEAIKFVSNKTQIFDFGGSMIENVAQSFQQFGAEQIPYFTISKSYSSILKFLLKFKGV